MELTQVVKLVQITPLLVVVVFFYFCAFKYGISVSLLLNNGPQFAVEIFHFVSHSLGITNVYMSTYHPQTNWQVWYYKRTITAMSFNCVHDHQNDWELYVSALTHSYNTQIQNSTNKKQFELVLGRPATDFTLHPNVLNRSAATHEICDEFSNRMDVVIQRAHGDFKATQECYKRSVDKRLRRTHRRLVQKTTYILTLSIGP